MMTTAHHFKSLLLIIFIVLLPASTTHDREDYGVNGNDKHGDVIGNDAGEDSDDASISNHIVDSNDVRKETRDKIFGSVSHDSTSAELEGVKPYSSVIETEKLKTQYGHLDQAFNNGSDVTWLGGDGDVIGAVSDVSSPVEKLVPDDESSRNLEPQKNSTRWRRSTGGKNRHKRTRKRRHETDDAIQLRTKKKRHESIAKNPVRTRKSQVQARKKRHESVASNDVLTRKKRHESVADDQVRTRQKRYERVQSYEKKHHKLKTKQKPDTQPQETITTNQIRKKRHETVANNPEVPTRQKRQEALGANTHVLRVPKAIQSLLKKTKNNRLDRSAALDAYDDLDLGLLDPIIHRMKRVERKRKKAARGAGGEDGPEQQLAEDGEYPGQSGATLPQHPHSYSGDRPGQEVVLPPVHPPANLAPKQRTNVRMDDDDPAGLDQTFPFRVVFPNEQANLNGAKQLPTADKNSEDRKLPQEMELGSGGRPDQGQQRVLSMMPDFPSDSRLSAEQYQILEEGNGRQFAMQSQRQPSQTDEDVSRKATVPQNGAGLPQNVQDLINRRSNIKKKMLQKRKSKKKMLEQDMSPEEEVRPPHHRPEHNHALGRTKDRSPNSEPESVRLMSGADTYQPIQPPKTKLLVQPLILTQSGGVYSSSDLSPRSHEKTQNRLVGKMPRQHSGDKDQLDTRSLAQQDPSSLAELEGMLADLSLPLVVSVPPHELDRLDAALPPHHRGKGQVNTNHHNNRGEDKLNVNHHGDRGEERDFQNVEENPQVKNHVKNIGDFTRFDTRNKIRRPETVDQSDSVLTGDELAAESARVLAIRPEGLLIVGANPNIDRLEEEGNRENNLPNLNTKHSQNGKSKGTDKKMISSNRPANEDTKTGVLETRNELLKGVLKKLHLDHTANSKSRLNAKEDKLGKETEGANDDSDNTGDDNSADNPNEQNEEQESKPNTDKTDDNGKDDATDEGKADDNDNENNEDGGDDNDDDGGDDDNNNDEDEGDDNGNDDDDDDAPTQDPDSTGNVEEGDSNMAMLSNVVDQYTQELHEQQAILDKIIQETQHAEELLHTKQDIQNSVLQSAQQQQGRLNQEKQTLLQQQLQTSKQAQPIAGVSEGKPLPSADIKGNENTSTSTITTTSVEQSKQETKFESSDAEHVPASPETKTQKPDVESVKEDGSSAKIVDVLNKTLENLKNKIISQTGNEPKFSKNKTDVHKAKTTLGDSLGDSADDGDDELLEEQTSSLKDKGVAESKNESADHDSSEDKQTLQQQKHVSSSHSSKDKDVSSKDKEDEATKNDETNTDDTRKIQNGDSKAEAAHEAKNTKDQEQNDANTHDHVDDQKSLHHEGQMLEGKQTEHPNRENKTCCKSGTSKQSGADEEDKKADSNTNTDKNENANNVHGNPKDVEIHRNDSSDKPKEQSDQEEDEERSETLSRQLLKSHKSEDEEQGNEKISHQQPHKSEEEEQLEDSAAFHESNAPSKTNVAATNSKPRDDPQKHETDVSDSKHVHGGEEEDSQNHESKVSDSKHARGIGGEDDDDSQKHESKVSESKHARGTGGEDDDDSKVSESKHAYGADEDDDFPKHESESSDRHETPVSGLAKESDSKGAARHKDRLFTDDDDDEQLDADEKKQSHDKPESFHSHSSNHDKTADFKTNPSGDEIDLKDERGDGKDTKGSTKVQDKDFASNADSLAAGSHAIPETSVRKHGGPNADSPAAPTRAISEVSVLKHADANTDSFAAANHAVPKHADPNTLPSDAMSPPGSRSSNRLKDLNPQHSSMDADANSKFGKLLSGKLQDADVSSKPGSQALVESLFRGPAGGGSKGQAMDDKILSTLMRQQQALELFRVIVSLQKQHNASSSSSVHKPSVSFHDEQLSRGVGRHHEQLPQRGSRIKPILKQTDLTSDEDSLLDSFDLDHLPSGKAPPKPSQQLDVFDLDQIPPARTMPSKSQAQQERTLADDNNDGLPLFGLNARERISPSLDKARVVSPQQSDFAMKPEFSDVHLKEGYNGRNSSVEAGAGNVTNATSLSDWWSVLHTGSVEWNKTAVAAMGLGLTLLLCAKVAFVVFVCFIVRWCRLRRYKKAFRHLDKSFRDLDTSKPVYLKLAGLKRAKDGNQYLVSIVDDTKFSVVEKDQEESEQDEEIFNVTDIETADKKGPLSKLNWTNPRLPY